MSQYKIVKIYRIQTLKLDATTVLWTIEEINPYRWKYLKWIFATEVNQTNKKDIRSWQPQIDRKSCGEYFGSHVFNEKGLSHDQGLVLQNDKSNNIK